MLRIAISYRRSDSSAIAGRIFDRLSTHYGPESVFMDIDDIPFGADFRTHIQDRLSRADVLVALVGTQWTGASAARIREPQDPVRMEIETAMARRVPIIPVLVDGAKMPEATAVPETFGNFAFLNAADVASGRDFHAQVDRLIGAIDDARGAVGSGTLSLTSSKLKSEAGNARAQARKRWLADLVLYLGVPIVLLLAAHDIIVNEQKFIIGNADLRIASLLVPLCFGFAFRRRSGRGTGAASAFALALGIIAEAGMSVSQNLNSGDPILPETRGESIEVLELVGTMALGFMAGYAAAQAWRAFGPRIGMR